MKKLIILLLLCGLTLSGFCADTKVSDLTEATDIQGTDELYLNDGGTSKKITATNLFDMIDTEAELESISNVTNILNEEEIDASSELLAIMDDETGTGALVFGTSPQFTTSFTTAGAFAISPGGALTIGDGGDTLTINTSDWDIDATGAITGASGSNSQWANDEGYITATLTEEEVEDFVGGMLGGTETLISVTYQDATNDIDFVVNNDLSQYDNGSSGFITATLTEEEVEDFVGGMLGGTETHIAVTYQDATNDIDFVVDPASVAGAIAEGELANSIVVSDDIKDDTIVNGDINSAAAIAISKTALVAGTNISLSTNTLNVDDAFLANTGDVGTGTFDFGGADDLELPNTAGDVTVDTAGQVAVDTAQDQLAVYTDTEFAIPLTHVLQGVIGTGVYDADSDVFIAELSASRFPDGIVITGWEVKCNEADPDTELDANLMYCDDNDTGAFPGANATLVDVIDTTTGNASEGTMGDSDLGSGTIPSGKMLYVDIDADPTSDTTLFYLIIEYYIPES